MRNSTVVRTKSDGDTTIIQFSFNNYHLVPRKTGRKNYAVGWDRWVPSSSRSRLMTIASGCDEQNRVACQLFALDVGITAGEKGTSDT